MRALSLSQPWASVVVHGPKRIENRPLQLSAAAARLQRTGELFAIHAAKSWDTDGADWIASVAPEYAPPNHERGALIGVARITAVGTLEWWRGRFPPGQAPWAFGPLCLLLADVAPLARPIPCRGMLGFWTVPADIEAALLAQIGGGQ